MCKNTGGIFQENFARKIREGIINRAREGARGQKEKKRHRANDQRRRGTHLHEREGGAGGLLQPRDHADALPWRALERGRGGKRGREVRRIERECQGGESGGRKGGVDWWIECEFILGE